MFISYPHFLYGNKTLFEKFEGLHPNEEAHGTVADIHTKLAFPISGHSRFQFNILVDANKHHPNITEDLILPILWIEVSSGAIPQPLLDLIKTITFSTTHLHKYLQIGFPIIICASLILMIISCFSYFKSKKLRDDNIGGDIVVTLGADKVAETIYI